MNYHKAFDVRDQRRLMYAYNTKGWKGLEKMDLTVHQLSLLMEKLKPKMSYFLMKKEESSILGINFALMKWVEFLLKSNFIFKNIKLWTQLCF